MISIGKSMNDIEVQRQLLLNSIEAILYVIDTIAQYAVETDAAALALFRSNLKSISGRLRPSLENPAEVEFSALRSDIRGTLREYRDHAQAWLDHLRADLNTTAEALGNLLATMQVEGSEADRQLKREISVLQSASELSTLEAIREQVSRSAARLADCAEALRLEKAGVIFQLKNEIQTLQKSLDEAQRAATLDTLTGLTSKDEFMRRLRRALVARAEIGVLHMRLRNLHRQMASRPEEVLRTVIVAVSKRMKNVLPPEAIATRWASDVFCILVPGTLIRRVAAELARCCPGQYTWMEGGSSQGIVLQSTITSLFPLNSNDADAVVQKLEELQFSPDQ